MIGPCDLNRIPRWTPERSSEDLHRYARLELGGEALGLRTTVRSSQAVRGLRAWLTSRLLPARASADRMPSDSLLTAVGAVHFDGEMDRQSRMRNARPERPAAAFATPAMAFTVPAKDDGSADLCTCDL